MMVDLRGVDLSVRDSDGLVSFQPDYYGNPDGETEGDKPGGNAFPPAHPYGFMSRPHDPSGKDPKALDGCECLIFNSGDEGRVMPTVDPRVLGLVPDTGAGGSVMWGAALNGERFDVSSMVLAGNGVPGQGAGGFRLRVPYDNNTKVHLIEIDLTANEIRLVHGDGPSVKLTQSNIEFTAPNGGVNITAATSVAFAAPGVAIGGSGGFPVVIDNGTITAAWIAIKAIATSLGMPFVIPVGFQSVKTKTV